MDLKTLTKEDVREVFLRLLDENGSTTSLDVKNELRKDGFHAVQDEVAPYLWMICDEEGVPFSYNGTYRTYTAPGTVPPSDDPDLGNVDDALSGMVPDSDDDVDTKPIDDPGKIAIGDWEVSDENGVNVLYYNGKIDVRTVKRLYADETGIDEMLVQTNRVASA